MNSLPKSRSANDAETIFQKRAEHLATRGLKVISDLSVFSVLTVHAGACAYGLPLDQVLEVIAYQDCMPVPGSAPEIAGVINIQNEICAVLDLGLLCGTGKLENSGFFVLLRSSAVGGRKLCLHVSSLDGVQSVSRSKLQHSQLGHSTLVEGISATGLSILDVSKLYSARSVNQHRMVKKGETK